MCSSCKTNEPQLRMPHKYVKIRIGELAVAVRTRRSLIGSNPNYAREITLLYQSQIFGKPLPQQRTLLRDRTV